MLSIRWAGSSFDLHADRAIYWRKMKSLIIADPHFGKAAAFRANGVPVPHGTTQANLERLSNVLHSTNAERLIVLGDFLHAAAGRADQTMKTIANWRERHCGVNIVLVRGNHDENAGDPPPEWGFACVDQPLLEGEFAFCHDPCAQDGAPGTCDAPAKLAQRFIFAGHVHPGAILRDVDGSSLRAACFHFSRRLALLPAFGAFTGMHPIQPQRGDRVFAVNEGSILEVKTVRA